MHVKDEEENIRYEYLYKKCCDIAGCKLFCSSTAEMGNIYNEEQIVILFDF